MTLSKILLRKQFLGVVLYFAVILVIFYLIAGRQISERVSAEVSYRQQYGADWKEHYSAERHVTVAEDHQKLIVATGSLLTVVLLCYLIYRQVVPQRSGRGGRTRSQRRRRTFTLPT